MKVTDVTVNVNLLKDNRRDKMKRLYIWMTNGTMSGQSCHTAVSITCLGWEDAQTYVTMRFKET